MKNSLPLIIAAILIVLVGFVVFISLDQKNIVNGSEEFNSSICWNKVSKNEEGQLYWQNGCKGANISPDITCTQLIVPLENQELLDYEAWVENGKPEIPGCTINP